MNISGMEVLQLVALFCGTLASTSANAGIIDIDNTELAKLMAAGVPLIDIRTAPEWQQTGMVPGSHLLTFFDQQGRADPASWLDQAKRIAKPGDPVIVICRSGNRTKAVSQFLSDQAGYKKVYNVRNGITAWTQEGRAVTPVSQSMVSCQTTNSC